MFKEKDVKMLFSPLSDRLSKVDFDCGVIELNDFILKRAKSFVKRGLCSVQTLVCEDTIIGYYTLSPFTLQAVGLPPEIAKKFPSNMMIPCWLIGKLAVDKKFQGKRLGELLLMDALKSVLEVAKVAGGYCVIVDAKNKQVKEFYRRYGFMPIQDNELRLFLPLASIEKLFS